MDRATYLMPAFWIRRRKTGPKDVQGKVMWLRLSSEPTAPPNRTFPSANVHDLRTRPSDPLRNLRPVQSWQPLFEPVAGWRASKRHLLALPACALMFLGCHVWHAAPSHLSFAPVRWQE